MTAHPNAHILAQLAGQTALDALRTENELMRNQLAEAQDALQAAQRLFKEALPKFNWGASFLDANAIQLLNEVPVKVDAAIATYLQTLAVTTLPKVSNES